jgi:hypothetical protein
VDDEGTAGADARQGGGCQGIIHRRYLKPFASPLCIHHVTVNTAGYDFETD